MSSQINFFFGRESCEEIFIFFTLHFLSSVLLDSCVGNSSTFTIYLCRVSLEGKGREGKGRDGKGREGKEREGKGRNVR